jgi:uncharacterized protein (TIGR02996 family)
MTYDDAFLQAILESPDDDTPRLIYADWLDEHGQDARAEFIRLQCQLSKLPCEDPTWPGLRIREQRLLAKHAREWLGDLRDAVVGWTFSRGFLDDIIFRAGNSDDVLDQIPPTVRRVRVAQSDPGASQLPITNHIPGLVARQDSILVLGQYAQPSMLTTSEPAGNDVMSALTLRVDCGLVGEVEAGHSSQTTEEVPPYEGGSDLISLPSDSIGITVDCGIDAETEAGQSTRTADETPRHPGESDLVRLKPNNISVTPDDISGVADAGDISIQALLECILQEGIAYHASRVLIEPDGEQLSVWYDVGTHWILRDPLPVRLHQLIVNHLRCHLAFSAGRTRGRQTGQLPCVWSPNTGFPVVCIEQMPQHSRITIALPRALEE